MPAVSDECDLLCAFVCDVAMYWDACRLSLSLYDGGWRGAQRERERAWNVDDSVCGVAVYSLNPTLVIPI